MSECKAEIVLIDKIIPHDNADKLEIAVIGGWTCVVRKDVFKAGNKVLYIPIDSVIPSELEAKIFGPDAKIIPKGGRIKTIRIRGTVSQGLVTPLEIFNLVNEPVGRDVTELLGIKKYEPPLPDYQSGFGKKALPRKAHPYFNKYTDIQNVKKYRRLFDEDEYVVASEKIHGCLQKRTKVLMADGSRKRISDIVVGDFVLGYNESNNIVPTKVLNTYKNGTTHDWMRIQFSRKKMGSGSSLGTVNCTPNHQFYLADKQTYTDARSLKVGDKVLSLRTNVMEMNPLQEQVLLGKLLGDGSLYQSAYSASVQFGHKIEHYDYVKWTLKALGSMANTDGVKSYQSGWGGLITRATTVFSPHIKDTFESMIGIDGWKYIPEWVADKLSPISIAFWYMDDGSLGSYERQESTARFAVCAFTQSDCEVLIRGLKKFGIKATYFVSEDKNSHLRLNSDEAEKLFLLIAPYIPPIMQYKLPERYRGCLGWLPEQGEEYKPLLVEQEIEEIGTMSKQLFNESIMKYDIETETHNFFANGILVHNSNFRCGYVPTIADTWTKKIKKFFGLLDKYEFVYGSHNVQLKNDLLDTDYQNVYVQTVEKYNLRKKLKHGEVLYGEIYGDGIQKNYSYGLTDKQSALVVFDLNRNGVYVPWDVLTSWTKGKGLKTPPEVYRGKFDFNKLQELTIGNSLLCPEQKIMEGLVIKSVDGRKVLKFISDQYLLKDNSDFH